MAYYELTWENLQNCSYKMVLDFDLIPPDLQRKHCIYVSVLKTHVAKSLNDLKIKIRIKINKIAYLISKIFLFFYC